MFLEGRLALCKNARIKLGVKFNTRGNLLCHGNNTNVFTSDWAVFGHHD